MANGFGMAVVPQQVGAALQQAPSTDLHQDPLPVRSDPPRTYEPRPVDTNIEHSATSTQLALGEALQRMQGERTGEYQQPKSPLALLQLKRAGLSDTEIAILTQSTGAPMAAQDATGGIVPSGPRGYHPGETEGLQSTANYWDNQSGQLNPPGRYFAAATADSARRQIPDAQSRQAAAGRVLRDLGMRRAR